MVRYFLGMLFLMLVTTSCSEHSGQNITLYTGDYRYDGAIGEFFDCASRKKYFISKAGIAEEMKSQYESLSLQSKDDAYVHVEGYVKSEPLMEGLDPENVFVATRLIKIDSDRGCHLRQ